MKLVISELAVYMPPDDGCIMSDIKERLFILEPVQKNPLVSVSF